MFAGVGLALAALGVYGVLVYYVSQRTRELGVRDLLGAPHRAVVGLVLRQALWPVIAGIVVGAVGSYLDQPAAVRFAFSRDARQSGRAGRNRRGAVSRRSRRELAAGPARRVNRSAHRTERRLELSASAAPARVFETVVADAGALSMPVSSTMSRTSSDGYEHVAVSRVLPSSSVNTVTTDSASGNGSKISVNTSAFGRGDLAIHAVERELALGAAADETPGPPGRRSISQTGTEYPLVEDAPPAPDVFGLGHRVEHEAPRRVEQARQRDLAIRRRRDLEGVAICRAAYGHVLLLRFQFLQIVVEAVEARFPDVAIALGPVGHFLEGAGLDPAGPPLGLASARDQARALEHAQVLRDGGHAHVERLGELGDRAFARDQRARIARASGPPGRQTSCSVIGGMYLTYELINL